MPLLEMASSSAYWPDFLVWVDRGVIAFDTKGAIFWRRPVSASLISDTLGGPAKAVLRLMAEGEAEALPSGQINRIGKHGCPVWSWKTHAQMETMQPMRKRPCGWRLISRDSGIGVATEHLS